MIPPSNELFRALESRVNFENRQPRLVEYKLDRMRAYAARAGNPQNDVPSFHIAGSKGKGSTAHYLAAGLELLGHKTGLYTSPHLRFWAERMTRAGSYWQANAYASALEEALSLAQDETVFEILTLAAWILFKNEECDYMVLETGLGGRLDATNLVTPLASILTLIELEHTEILGDTLEQIAGEKAGIIKPGVPAWTYLQTQQALDVFLKKTRESRSELFILEREWDLLSEPSPQGYRMAMRNKTYSLAWNQETLGKGTAKNAALALAVLLHRFPLHQALAGELAAGMGRVTVPGRLQLIPGDPPFVLDGAHTEESLIQAADAVLSRWPRSILVYGSSADKDVGRFSAFLRDRFQTIILSGFSHPRAAPVTSLKQYFPDQAEAWEEPGMALERARSLCSEGGAVLVAGSFFLVGAVQDLLQP